MTVGAAQSVVSPDGTRIAAWRSGTGDPLVLVHGTTADHTRWARVLPVLSSHFSVYAIDRRGRGASGDSDQYAIEREIEDVAAVIDSIAGPVTLVGHSWGAICSLEATRLTAGVERLILYEPPIPVGIEIYPPGLLDRLEALLDAGDREGVLITFMTEVLRVAPRQAELLRGLPGWEGRVAAAHTVVRETRAHAHYQFDSDGWGQFNVPTLLLYGGESPPFLIRATEMLHEVIPGSTLRELPGHQHLAMETAPRMFAAVVMGQ